VDCFKQAETIFTAAEDAHGLSRQQCISALVYATRNADGRASTRDEVEEGLRKLTASLDARQVRVFACVCKCAYTCIHTCMKSLTASLDTRQACVLVCICVCVCMCMPMCACQWCEMILSVCVCVCLCVYICVCVCIDGER
jgi:hypothetical protein